MQSQQEVWENISFPWNEYRKNPLKEVTEFLKDKKGKLLDLGCGNGKNIIEFNGTIYGVDFSKNQIKNAKKLAKNKKVNAKFFNSKASNLEFNNNFFDSVIFIATLHSIDSEKERLKSLEELYRVLKPNSFALISVWSRNHKRIKNKPKEALIPWTFKGKKYLRYYYIYKKNELEKLLKSIGFKIMKSWEDMNLFFIVEKH